MTRRELQERAVRRDARGGRIDGLEMASVKRFGEVLGNDEFLRTFPPPATVVPNNNFRPRGLRAGLGKGAGAGLT